MWYSGMPDSVPLVNMFLVIALLWPHYALSQEVHSVAQCSKGECYPGTMEFLKESASRLVGMKEC
jgi:hypothetical protein